MAELPAIILEQARGLWGLEGLAVSSAIAYLLLAIRQNITCWLFAGISTAIYIYLFFAARLYMESVLNVFYLAMAVYGWYSWRRGEDKNHALRVSIWPWRRHALAISIILAGGLINGYLLQIYSNAEWPYVDSLTTWSAMWATYLIARKVLENWWYWLAIDTASIYIYWNRDLELTALLFVAYVMIIPFGLMSWKRSMNSLSTSS